MSPVTVFRATRGVTSVELAIVAPILALLMFSIVEFSLMCGCLVQVNNIARSAARAAAAGEPLDQIDARIRDSLSGLAYEDLSITLTSSEYQGDATWSDSWEPLQTAGSLNSAMLNDRVQCVARYSYHLAIPGIFRGLADNPQSGTKTLTARAVMVRG